DASTSSTGSVGVTGLQGSDTVTGLTQSFDSKNAGSRTLSVGGGYSVNDGNSGGNYTVTTQVASGTINKAALTLAAAADTKTYDATTTSTGAVGVTGLQGSDTVTGLSQAFDSKNAGSRTLSVGGGYSVNDGNSGGNYTVTTQTASGTINKAALTLAAATDTKTYDATTSSTGTVGVTGLQGSDTVTGLTQSYDSKNAGGRTLGVDAGYTVNDGNSGGNYTVTTQTASGVINKAALTAGLTGSVEKIYDATTDADLTNANYALSGVLGSDKVALNDPAHGVYASQNVGSGQKVSVSGIALTGQDAGNYTVNASASANIGVIDQRPITVAADDLGKIVDAADPALTWKLTFGDLVGGDAVTGSLTRDAGENPGHYAITQGSLAASSNYKVTFVGATFTITPTGLQNQPVVNVVQNTPPPPSPTSTDNGSGASSGDSGAGASGSGASGDNGSGQNSSDQNSSGQNTADGQSAGGQGVGGDNENATDPNVHHGSSSSDTCVTGEACSNQPYPGNQQFSSYVSFLSH
ncbi:MAG: YDG domain-containing protein, partial [Asticcacaulis sp.]|uniref:YDG domain-containing protein n=1 Tax=Asticcacaulis sp. TaxID=1872648 RepID=UPI003F7CB183